MTTDERIDCLEAKRRDLKAAIAAESRRLHPDEVGLRRMKTLKCQLKDQIARLRAGTSVSAVA